MNISKVEILSQTGDSVTINEAEKSFENAFFNPQGMRILWDGFNEWKKKQTTFVKEGLNE